LRDGEKMVVGEMFLRNANKFPEKIAIVSKGLSINYHALNERVNRLANVLIRKGLRKGDRIGVLVHNCYQFVEIYFAAAKTGGIFCPYNNHLKEKELTEIMNYSSPRFLILDEDFADIIRSTKSHLESLELYICLQEPRWPFMLSYEALISKGEKKEPEVKIRNEDIMSIFFTAGTTGRPKGAVRTHGHVVSNAITGVIELKVSYDERVLISFPMYHVAGEDNIGRHFFMPNTVFIRREGRFDPEEVLELLSTGKITICQFVPTMMNALLQFRDIDKYDLSNLRLIIYTGSPMPVELLKRALQKIKCGFVQLYGQTEGGPTITILYPDDHMLEGSDQQLQKLGSAGRPVISYEVRIVNDQGKDVSVGEVGEIIGRSEAVMKRYWRLPKETAKKLKDGWLHTGDLGKFDEGGYLYIVDRKGDMIISGGVNIYPREVEEILYQHPSVLEASVIGVPDDYWGEAVKAIIVLKEGATVSGDEIIKFCGDHLASYKKPKSVEFWMELPKSPQGKILKKEIRKRYISKPD
jgi:acyl-CoA synthetase (AMP-forming)/AMP-acid ligase II